MSYTMRTYQLKQDHLDKLNNNPDVLDKWVEALLSGEYKQGGGLLYSSKYNTFCCLGVAEKVVGNKSVKDLDKMCAPSELDEYISCDGLILESIETECGADLASLNDGHDFTFKQISNLLLGKKVRKKA